MTKNNSEAFALYAEVYHEHNSLVDNNSDPLGISEMIKDVNIFLLDKIARLKALGLDDETYEAVVDNVFIVKYQTLIFLLAQFAKGGFDVLNIATASFFKEFSLDDIAKSINDIRTKLALTSEQEDNLKVTEDTLATLKKKGLVVSNNDNSGCLRVLMALAILLFGLLGLIICI